MMLEIQLHNIAKRFQFDWIIKDLNFSFKPNSRTAITGLNGKGKSTLLKLIAGMLLPSSGSISYKLESNVIDEDQWYKYYSFAAPHIQLFQELTAGEIFDLISTNNPMLLNDKKTFLNLAELDKENTKPIKFYSSGMHQRLSLSLAICSAKPILILDEPTSFLDINMKSWYHNLISEYSKDKTVIIASNDKEDYNSCIDFINL